MKKILLLLSACVVLSSCAIQKYSQKTYLADYREYTADGFTIPQVLLGLLMNPLVILVLNLQ